METPVFGKAFCHFCGIENTFGPVPQDTQDIKCLLWECLVDGTEHITWCKPDGSVCYNAITFCSGPNEKMQAKYRRE